jgi:hypothetical protein
MVVQCQGCLDFFYSLWSRHRCRQVLQCQDCLGFFREGFTRHVCKPVKK